MTIAEIQDEVTEEFSVFDDWQERYEYTIEFGRSIPLIETQYKTDEYLIKGCQSRVWLHAGLKDNKVIFTGDSDAVITKGIIAILIRVLSHQEPSAIAEADMAFLDEIGLKEHLSPTRANGLLKMIKQMKLYALAYQAKIDSGSS